MCKEEVGIKAMSSAAESAAEGEERHNPTEEGAVEVERKPTSVTADAVKYEEKPDLGQRAEEDGADKAALSVTDLAAAAGSGKTESEAAAGAAREGLTPLKVGKLDSDVQVWAKTVRSLILAHMTASFRQTPSLRRFLKSVVWRFTFPATILPATV